MEILRSKLCIFLRNRPTKFEIKLAGTKTPYKATCPLQRKKLRNDR